MKKLSMYQHALVIVKEAVDSFGSSAHSSEGPMHEIQRRIDDLQKIVSPFRRINQDILHDVFLYYVEADHESHDAFNIRPAPWILSVVCKSWRDLALSVAQLWGYIQVGAPEWWFNERTKTQVSRAKGGPFHLKLAPETALYSMELSLLVEPMLRSTKHIVISSASPAEVECFDSQLQSIIPILSKNLAIALVKSQGLCSKARFSLTAPSPLISVLDDGEAGELRDEYLRDIELTRSCYILYRFTASRLRTLKITDVPRDVEDEDGLTAHILINFAVRSSLYLTTLTLVRVSFTDHEVTGLISACPDLTHLTLHDLDRCKYTFLTELEHHPKVDPLAYAPFLQDVTVPLCTHTVGFVNTRSHDYGPHDFVKKLRRVHLKGPFPAGVSLLMDKMSGAVERGVQIYCDPL